LNGDKEAALAELKKAQAGDPGFEKQFRSAVAETPQLKPLGEDKEFLSRLFPPH